MEVTGTEMYVMTESCGDNVETNIEVVKGLGRLLVLPTRSMRVSARIRSSQGRRYGVIVLEHKHHGMGAQSHQAKIDTA